MDSMTKIQNKVKCPICTNQYSTRTIFRHIADCDNDVKFMARMLIAQLEVELGEQK